MEKGEQREQINCLCLKFSLQKYFIGILYITLRIRIRNITTEMINIRKLDFWMKFNTWKSQ